MRWVTVRVALAAGALGAGACDELGLGPHRVASAPAAPAEARASAPDLRSFAGQTYASFIAQPGMERYSLTALGLRDHEQARFTYSMANPAPAILASGGGAEALVFSGCAPAGCLEGLSVVAIDVATGQAFVGVSDGAGAAELVPNDRLEALLRLTSPSQTWDDPIRPRAAPG